MYLRISDTSAVSAVFFVRLVLGAYVFLKRHREIVEAYYSGAL